jgi:lipopolysaccharide/colanic/teichoic acid biosynthesis glycosyltransferase
MKRLLDLLVSSAALVALSPLLACIAIAIKCNSPGPVFYRGKRVGVGGRLFDMLKFRTMVVDADKVGGSSTPEDDPRITRVGHWLRRTKLDELPQLVNVVRGEMSLVGPRPQVEWAVKLYNDGERRLLTVPPGITDYASIRFSDEAAILKGSADPDRDYLEKIAPDKIRYGLAYVRDRSLRTDLRILWATAAKLFGRDATWVLPPLPPRGEIDDPSGRR